MHFLAALLILSLFSVSATASDSSTVAAGATVEITGPDSVCKSITNNASTSEYVPTTSTAEWQSFIANHPATTVVGACDPCSGSPSAGTVCADGSIYAGLSPDGNVKMYTTRCDAGQTWSGSACTGTASTKVWDSSNVDITAVTNCTSAASCDAYGKANSAAIVAQRGSAAAAAYYCENLTEDGQSDWYLPALSELNKLYTNKTAIGNFDTSGPTWYWSSSENTANYAWIERFIDGNQAYGGYKGSSYRVRCVRR